MTEELSQDSSRPQETSQDSGVSSESQLSNSTGKNATVQSNQNSQAPTTQNNKNNKKYDLGVLFVHGIGNHERGETFEAMYDSIKDELASDEDIYYSESNRSASAASGTMKLGGHVKKVLFCESNWDLPSLDGYGENNDSNRLSFKMAIRCCVIFLQIACWSIYVLGMRISKSLNFPIFILGFSAIFSTFDRTSDTQEGRQYLLLLACLGIVIIFFVIYLMRKDKKAAFYLASVILYVVLLFWGPGGILHSVIVFAPVTVLSLYVCIKAVKLCGELIYFYSKEEEIIPKAFENIQKLWNQINVSADYVRTGKVFFYIKAVERSIDEMVKMSDQVIIVAHSMGEYLSYNSLKRNSPSYEDERIHLIGIGGGLGLVSLIGRLRASKKDNELNKAWSIIITTGSVVLSCGLVWVVCSLWNSFYNSFSKFLSNPLDINFLREFFLSLLCIFILYAFIYFIVQIMGIEPLGVMNFKFHKYSHWLDPVGNSANFFYSNKADMYITPKILPGHGLPTYFVKGSKLRKMKNLNLRHDDINGLYVRQMIAHHMKSSVFEKVPSLEKVVWYNLIIFICSSISLWVSVVAYEFAWGVPLERINYGSLIYISMINMFLYPTLVLMNWYGKVKSFAELKQGSSLKFDILSSVFIAFGFGIEGSFIIDILYSYFH